MSLEKLWLYQHTQSSPPKGSALYSEWLWATERGVIFISENDEDYPPGFRDLSVPPKFLAFWGDKALLQKSALSIVGARHIQEETRSVLSELIVPSVIKDTVIVSGGARGVDRRTHDLALLGGIQTIAIIPSGFKALYPENLRELVPLIQKGKVAFLSEYAPFTEMKKYHFIHRNRLIASYSPLTLVAQAAIRSGSLLTARWCIELHREVAVFPGIVRDAAFSGNVQLWREGAHLVVDRDDLELLMNRYCLSQLKSQANSMRGELNARRVLK